MTQEPQPPNVEQLIQDFQRGRKAQVQLITLAEKWVREQVKGQGHELLRRRIGESAEVQEAWIQVFMGLDTFTGNTEAEFRKWVHKTVENKRNDLLRQQWAAMRTPAKEEPLDVGPDTPHGSSQLPSPVPTPSQQAMGREEKKRLEEAMDKLSSEHRQVIFLRQWDKLGFEEIGHRMSRTEDAAKKLHQRAFLELRRHMKEDNQ